MEGIRKIMNHLWFDKEAAEAGEFYLRVFENSRLLSRRMIHGTPSEDAESLILEIENINLLLLSAGPYFQLNPSISLMISCASKDEVLHYWEAFLEGGTIMMPLERYDFSELYGWVSDQFGVSWQIMYTDAHIDAKIRPSLMFAGANFGRAEEAIGFYSKVFGKSEIKTISRYGEKVMPNAPQAINFAELILEGQSFAVMENNQEHLFGFNEAFSFIVNCDTQEEIDHYWDSLSAVPEAEQCGWLKDQFGVSWQITPAVMNDMMQQADPAAIERVTQAFLKMKKFDLAELERAYKGD
ncbi:MAG: VOC family protein [Anaerofustis sp.]